MTVLGRIGKLLYTADTYQAGIDTATDALFDQFNGTEREWIPEAISAVAPLRSTAASGLETYFQLADRFIRETVGADYPPALTSTTAALIEFRRQLIAATETVKRCTVTSVATALTGNKGTGNIVTTVTRGDGLPQENMIAETARVSAATDSYTLTATAGQEQFIFAAPPQKVTRYDYNFPGTSGASSGFLAISPDSTGNLGSQITNGDFEDFATANTPDDWTITVGTPGTQLLSDAVTYYDGAKSLQVPGSATLLNISQVLDYCAPLTAYAVNLWVIVDTTPAAGVLTIDLYSATAGAVVADDQATNNTFTIALTGLTSATWTVQNGVFRMPKNPPADTALRIRMTTALTSGRTLNIDRVCIAPMSVPYVGGPGLAVFSGATPFVVGDGWNVVNANNQGGSTYGATFQTLFDRFFGMRELRLVLPSTTGSPTHADTLITS